ncbi:MAG: hypothetical protein NTX52_05240 [Planctomycetota bacterium]|nr:hypothetical protein [Planctomycetota bacterium]
MRKFQEYYQDKSISDWLITNGYEVNEQNIQALIEAGFFDKAKKWGQKAALPLALAAGMGGMAQGGERGNLPRGYNRYSASGEFMYGSPQAHKNFQQDVKDVEQGREPGEHSKWGSPIKVNAFTEMEMRSAIGEINKKLQANDIFLDVTQISQEGKGTHVVIMVSAHGILARGKFEARTLVVNRLKETMAEHGISIKDMKILGGEKENIWNAFDVKQEREAVDQKQVLFYIEMLVVPI